MSTTAQQLFLFDMHLGRYILYLSRVLNFHCEVIKFYMNFEAAAAAAVTAPKRQERKIV